MKNVPEIVSEYLTHIFRESFEKHSMHIINPTLALRDAREAVACEIPYGVRSKLDDEHLAVTVSISCAAIYSVEVSDMLHDITILLSQEKAKESEAQIDILSSKLGEDHYEVMRFRNLLYWIKK
jgi:tRNA G10  N-methylase Trm11